MTLIAQIGYPQIPCTLHSSSPPNSLRLKTTRGWSSARSTWWGAGGRDVTDSPVPQNDPRKECDPGPLHCMGCRTVAGLGHPRPAPMLKSPRSHFSAFLGRAQAGQGRPSSSQWPRICGAPAVSDAAARGRYCTQRAAGSFLRGGGPAPTSTTRRPDTPPGPRTQDPRPTA